MKIYCKDKRKQSRANDREGRAMSSVSSDVDRLLGPKSYEELETLETQINRKLDSNEPIDTDYWESLLKSLLVWKARAKLKKIYQAVIDSRLEALRAQQAVEADAFKVKLASDRPDEAVFQATQIDYDKSIDPDPMLQLRPEDKALGPPEDEGSFLQRIVCTTRSALIMTDKDQVAERRKTRKMGYVPMRQPVVGNVPVQQSARPRETTHGASSARFAAVPNEDFSQATKDLYEKEVARGVGENEEIFAGEETVDTKSKPLWAGKYRPRKPKYFNRVQMGYEWNKYNQTHYDHDNPPPKVVQGYKFNIFYPDLIDKSKAPTYKIEREGGRKKGQSFAPAGEEDTCLIRFISGPPYEDIAFRIVDKEWDYSAKRERGFKSSFDKGILQLHFQFKKVSSLIASSPRMLT